MCRKVEFETPCQVLRERIHEYSLGFIISHKNSALSTPVTICDQLGKLFFLLADVSIYIYDADYRVVRLAPPYTSEADNDWLAESCRADFQHFL